MIQRMILLVLKNLNEDEENSINNIIDNFHLLNIENNKYF